LFSENAKSEDIANYLLELSKETVKENYKILSIVLDNAQTHKDKMKNIFFDLLKSNNLEGKIIVNFIHTARYSPKLNLAEYAIHLIRQKFFYNLPDNMLWKQIKIRISTYLQSNQIFTQEQVGNTLNHIYSLVA